MDADLVKFRKQLEGFVKATETAMLKAFQEIVIEVGTSVVTLSPVLTGRFKGNWQMTIGDPSTSSLINYDGDGADTIRKLLSGAQTLTLGQVAYIVNNLTYGYNIEVGGWPSGKQPYAPVRTTEAKFPLIVQAAVAKHKVDK